MLFLDTAWALWRIERNTRLLLNSENDMDQALADLTNTVEQTKTTQASAIALINGIAARIDALNSAKTAELTALAASLRDSSTQLATAVDAQAPAQPPVTATL